MAEIEALPAGKPLDPAVPPRDPILDDIFSRASIRELRTARDELAAARARYDEAVTVARSLGLSWGQIGTILGVSRQQLHRRFRDRCV